jgi:hypothetical protein
MKDSFGQSNTDWEDAEKRRRFIQKCEPLVEQRFCAESGFSVPWGTYLTQKQNSFFAKTVANFSSNGCHCLDEFFVASKPIDLTLPPASIIPVASAEWRGHEGAEELPELTMIVKQPDKRYFVALCFWDYPEAFIICEKPFRVLRKGCMYVRVRPMDYSEQPTKQLRPWPSYWFNLYDSREIDETLQKLVAVADFTTCNWFSPSYDRVLDQVSRLTKLGFSNVYLEINALNGAWFTEMAKRLPGTRYSVFALKERQYEATHIVVKGGVGDYSIIAPITDSSGSSIKTALYDLDKNKFVLLEGAKVAPDFSDIRVASHLATYGW